MVHSSRWLGGMRYGPGSPRERPHDRGDSSSDTRQSREPESPDEALRRQPEDRPQLEGTQLRRGPADRTEGAATDVLSVEEEAIVIAFRRHTLLPLDDSLYALQATIPRLTRSSLHRCFQRHGISRLPEVEGDKPEKKRFKSYPIGFFHIDLAEVRTEEGKLYLYVAVDRTSKFAFVQLVENANTVTARAFLDALVAAVPYQIEIVLTIPPTLLARADEVI